MQSAASPLFHHILTANPINLDVTDPYSCIVFTYVVSVWPLEGSMFWGKKVRGQLLISIKYVR